MSKYIDTIVITKDGVDTVVTYDDPNTLDQSLDLLEKLPSKLLSEVSAYATDVKAFRDNIVSYTSSQDKDVPLDIDVALFAGI